MDGVGQMLKLFQDQAVLPIKGMVEPQNYAMAREESCKFKEVSIGLASDDNQRVLYEKL